MGRKLLPGVKNHAGQQLRVTVGAAHQYKEARIIDPTGILALPSAHTPESKAAMSEYIRKRKNGETDLTNRR